MRINNLLNAIGIMTVIILLITALFLTAGCSTAGSSKKPYIQILYEGEMRPQEDIAVVVPSMKHKFPRNSNIPPSHLRIINIDGIKIAETITEVTPGVHRCEIKCQRVESTWTTGRKTHKHKIFI